MAGDEGLPGHPSRKQDHQHVTGDGPSDILPTPRAAGESRIVVPEAALLGLLGKRDENLREAEDLLDADVHVRVCLLYTSDAADE